MGASRPQTPWCFLVLDYLFSSTRKLQFYVELAGKILYRFGSKTVSPISPLQSPCPSRSWCRRVIGKGTLVHSLGSMDLSLWFRKKLSSSESGNLRWGQFQLCFATLQLYFCYITVWILSRWSSGSTREPWSCWAAGLLRHGRRASLLSSRHGLLGSSR